MFLARVQGQVVATVKDPAVRGLKLLVVEPLKVVYTDDSAAANKGGDDGGRGSFEPTGRAIVAMDTLGAGEGELVLITQGSSARMAAGLDKVPTDAVVIGIVNQATIMGKDLK